MCYVITGTLSIGVDLARVRAVVSPEGSSWEPVSNPFVESQLPEGWGYFHITGSYCDCRSALVRSEMAHGRNLKLPRAAARWSEPKRKRWLEQKTANRGDVSAWHEYLKRVLDAVHKAPVGLLIHFYKGSVAGERIGIVRRNPMKLNEIKPAELQSLEPDVLYEFY